MKIAVGGLNNFLGSLKQRRAGREVKNQFLEVSK